MKELLKKKLALILLCINMAFLSSSGKQQIGETSENIESVTCSLEDFMQKILSIVDCDNETDTLYLNNLVRPNAMVAYQDYAMSILYDDNSDHYPEKIEFCDLTVDDFSEIIFDLGYDNIVLNPFFQAYRIDEENYNILYCALNNDKTCLSNVEDDYYLPLELDKRVQDGIIYGTGIVDKERCVELLKEHLKWYLLKYVNDELLASLDSPNLQLLNFKFNEC